MKRAPQPTPEPVLDPRVASIASQWAATGEPPAMSQMLACAQELTPEQEEELFGWWQAHIDGTET